MASSFLRGQTKNDSEGSGHCRAVLTAPQCCMEFVGEGAYVIARC